MSYQEVMKSLKKEVSPVYMIYGTETYFIEKLKKELIKQVLGQDKENLSIYELDETPIQEVVTDTETYPFFGGRKLVFANNPVFLKAKPDKISFEHEVNVLEKYLSHPVDYTVLVLIAPYEKIDERKKVSKLLKKQATVAICNPIKEYEVNKWIKDLAVQFNITIDQDALEIFETELSTNLQMLENELTKLALYVGENGIITREVAEKLIAHTADNSSLRLVDAVIEGDLYKAIAIAKDLQKLKEEPIALIGLLSFQFRTILRVKLLKQKGYTQAQMQKQLGVHPYVIKIALSRERRFQLHVLQLIMDKLANADAAMKVGGMEKELTLELLLYDLVQIR
ncbi:DNA polymerase III subunit delta [Oceanobacillus manasiensis]|uniref:DNA polymerase III subunit delta n=1 Tax=Oceanobacillus manasiensis TaxID=586413 RepID=UPI0005A9F798|nr:DNA polymerase III subunit delta [Oceanobacillus manasiensis]